MAMVVDIQKIVSDTLAEIETTRAAEDATRKAVFAGMRQGVELIYERIRQAVESSLASGSAPEPEPGTTETGTDTGTADPGAGDGLSPSN